MSITEQPKNMCRGSNFTLNRRGNDNGVGSRAQISQVRRAHADPFRSFKHARKCILPPQVHSWVTPPPLGTATCEMGVHRQPKGSSEHNRAPPQPRTCPHSKSLQACPWHPQSFPPPPLPPLPTPDRPDRPRSPAFACRGPASSRRGASND